MPLAHLGLPSHLEEHVLHGLMAHVLLQKAVKASTEALLISEYEGKLWNKVVAPSRMHWLPKV